MGNESDIKHSVLVSARPERVKNISTKDLGARGPIDEEI